jgi:hypothetical protein
MAIEPKNIEFLLTTIAEAYSTSDAMNRLLDYCADQCPDECWRRLRKLDTRRDVAGISSWLEAVLLNEPPPPSINALYFGLFDEAQEGLNSHCRLYVAGSDRFDASDQSAEWVVDPAYFPERRYLPSAVLLSLSAEARGCSSGQARGFIEYLLCLGHALLAVKESRRRLAANPQLHLVLRMPMAVGFDSGDVFLLPSDPEPLVSRSTTESESEPAPE